MEWIPGYGRIRLYRVRVVNHRHIPSLRDSFVRDQIGSARAGIIRLFLTALKTGLRPGNGTTTVGVILFSSVKPPRRTATRSIMPSFRPVGTERLAQAAGRIRLFIRPSCMVIASDLHHKILKNRIIWYPFLSYSLFQPPLCQPRVSPNSRDLFLLVFPEWNG
jgi:hypothetical protein